ncbi:MAG TPA: LuxR C-terminal-related transcriptional regulator, partial [Gaiellaceae bacterium]
RLLDSLGADLPRALDELGLPLYLVDTNGVIRWLNRAAVDVIGDAVGLRFVDVLAPEAARRARQEFAAKLLGTKKRSGFSLVVLGAGGRTHRFEVASVPIVHEDRIVGVFGAGYPLGHDAPGENASREQLTPRQREVLALLSDGRSTKEIARELGIAEETARNHIRHLLRRLGARSRLAAVLEARRLGLDR